LHLADVRELFRQNPLLGLDLDFRTQVLQVTTAAGAEMRAWRRHAVRAGLQQFDQCTGIEIFVFA
jgi:hypothetical protein